MMRGEGVVGTRGTRRAFVLAVVTIVFAAVFHAGPSLAAGPVDTVSIRLPPRALQDASPPAAAAGDERPERAAARGAAGEEHVPRRLRARAAADTAAADTAAELVELQARAAAEQGARDSAAAALLRRVTAEDADRAAEQAGEVVLEGLKALPEDQRVVAHMSQAFLAGIVHSAYGEAQRRAGAPALLEEREGASGPKPFEAPGLVESDETGEPGPDDEDSNRDKPVVGTVNLMRMPRFAEQRAAARAKATAKATAKAHAKAQARARAEAEQRATAEAMAEDHLDRSATLPPDLTGSPEFAELQAAVRHEHKFIGKAFKWVGKVVKKGWNAVKNFGKKVFGIGKKKTTPAPKPKAAAPKDSAPTREQIEDCYACKMVWEQVEMDVGDARYAEDVQASFEHNCMDAQKSTIFYTACEDMYDDVYAMTDDYMSSKYNVDQLCVRAALCKAAMVKTK